MKKSLQTSLLSVLTIILLTVGAILLVLGAWISYRHFTYHPVCMGIDVSHHNDITGKNTPEAFKSLDSIQFLIAKATQGDSFKDSEYNNYKAYAKKMRLKFGAYHFLTRNHDAYDQFDHFRKVAGREIDIIPCLDIESYDDKHWSRSEAREKLNEWNEKCKEYYGVYPIVYCNEFYRLVYFNDMPNKFWICNKVTRPLRDCVIHQYTNNHETLDYNYLPYPIENILL
ncbi:MAG: glycoside hydrolase family 25 protein [Muribaculaceae bacterium]|nr:glycoside hydrolase family 25 protein [Muribaculaceae bacterium]